MLRASIATALVFAVYGGCTSEDLAETQAEENLRLAATQQEAAAGTPIGWVERHNSQEVVGWTCDPSNWDHQVWLHIYRDGNIVGAALADIPREEAVGETCGNGHSAHGFVFTWPTSIKDNRAHTYVVYALNVDSSGNEVGSNPPLRWLATNGTSRSITLYHPNYNPPQGYVDRASSMFLEGWTCNNRFPYQPLTVEITADGRAIGSAVADIPREAAVGNSCGGGAAHGFQFRWPDSLRDGLTHTIRVTARNIGSYSGDAVLRWVSNQQLSGSVNLGGGTMPPLPDLIARNFTSLPGGWEVGFDICNIGQQPAGNFIVRWLSPRSLAGGTYEWASASPLWTLGPQQCFYVVKPTFITDTIRNYPASRIEVWLDTDNRVIESNEANYYLAQPPLSP